MHSFSNHIDRRMSQDKKRRKKKHHKKKSDEQSGERPQSRLFTEADANSVETSGYTVGHGAPQTNKLVPDNVIPTGVGKLLFCFLK